MTEPVEQKVDYLEEDPEIRSQKYVLLSFISPEDVIKNKNTYFLEKFLASYVAKLKIDTMEKFLVDLIPKINKEHSCDIKVQDVLPKLEDYIRDNSMTFKEENVEEEYKTYLMKNQDTLDQKYLEENSFQTSIRGVKVRGTYEFMQEAQMRADRLRKQDPTHNIFIGQVGYWLPWDPDASKIEDQEYAEKELNDLMKNYKINELKKKDLFEQEKRAAMEAALRDNRKVQDDTQEGVNYENTVIPKDMFGTQQDNVLTQLENSTNTQSDDDKND